MAGLPASAFALLGSKLRDIASDIVTVRTGTVVSNYAAMSSTIVTLDNDPDQVSVQAQSLWQALPAGARVTMIAFPPRGLFIVGPSVALTPTAAPFTQIFGGPTSIPRPTDSTLKYIEIECIGGGGAGGGAAITAAGESSFGAGGSSGMWCFSTLRISDLTWPLSGTGGAAGAGASGTTGGAGGASFVQHSPGGVPTDLVRALGGRGGTTLASASTLGSGLTGASGNLGGGFAGQTASYGGDGGSVTRYIATGPQSEPNYGGASFYGGGGAPAQNNSNGNAASAVGAGGGGANNPASVTAKTGGAGQVGWVLYRFR